MMIFDSTWLKPDVVMALHTQAKSGEYDPLRPRAENSSYRDRCRAYHQATNAVLTLTRDASMVATGFMESYQHDRCLHLSIQFGNPSDRRPQAFNHLLAASWAEAIFGGHQVLEQTWVQMPTEQDPTGHFRVFANRAWMPLGLIDMHEGELHEKGWKRYRQDRNAEVSRV